MEGILTDQNGLPSSSGTGTLSDDRPDNGPSLFSGLYRKDSVDELHRDDPVLNPESEMFDPSKYGRRLMRAMDAQGISLPRIGVAFQDLSVSGSRSALRYQQTVLSPLTSLFGRTGLFSGRKETHKVILNDFDGLLDDGELLLVLGRPGSGCTTFLRTLCGQTRGLTLSKDSKINYAGITLQQMVREFRGQIAYNAEVEWHFPHLTVGQTLEFAAASRTPHHRIDDVSRKEYIKTTAKVAMAIFGLSHTYRTKVGNEFVLGVSGGERKRVSIAEMALSGARIGAWDNSTRGLDAATALAFVRALRLSADLGGSCHAVAAYQASQAIYNTFDKVIVLYSGREIFFGSCRRAVEYFEEMGWQRSERQVAGDFLTAITNPSERKAREGMEDKVPRTVEEFQQYWKKSEDYNVLRRQLASQASDRAHHDQKTKALIAAKSQQQAKHVRSKSPYIISLPMQIRLCIKRSYQRLWNEKASTLATVNVQIILSLIIGSIFYNTPDSSVGFFQKGAVLFFSVLMNALITINEITVLYSQRLIVEKQATYAFVHPFAEALATLISDLPIKLFRCACFSIILYFLTNLRREPSHFFVYFLFLMLAVLTMSSIFRTLAAATKTVGHAMAMAGVLVIAIALYTGFTLPQPYMHPWFAWIRWVNPIYYAFEALVTNEFHGRNFECLGYVPNYPNLAGDSFICSVTGAVAGERYVSGDRFIEQNYHYAYSHIWRNLGIVIAFWIFFTFTYLAFSEICSGSESQAEYLVFRKGHAPAYVVKNSGTIPDEEKPVTRNADAENGPEAERTVSVLPEQHDILTWNNLVYEIPVADGTQRLLDNVSGWVKPGTLTALMGVSGAGKTTLLDVIADRVSIGVVTGDILISGMSKAADFQRQTGYVQQQDLHMETATVREALRFSAMLRQPKTVSKEEKYTYVEEVVKMLGMEDFAEAVIGRPGEGLNVEQRKLLSIGVELAAKPAFLLFLDEPTSGLDSQSSWAICNFLRHIADHGQAVLCTIHQPSAMLFQEFDRLLFLAKGGKPVYFGDIGRQSRTLLDYFERNGARHCRPDENPAEYMLEVVGDVSSGDAKTDWVAVWNKSQEAKGIQEEISRIHVSRGVESSGEYKRPHTEFAMPLSTQIYHAVYRALQQNYRTPQYIYAKLILGIVSALFIGFSFWMPNGTQQGFQGVLFSLFLLCSIFSSLVNQIMPKFVAQRELYEVRERPSKTYSWIAFILGQLTSELPWHVLLGVLAWASYYWSVFGAGQTDERHGLILLFLIQFYIYALSFALLVIVALPNAATGGILATLCFGLTLIFNGVMQPPSALPDFWTFMYRVSPLTYYVGGISSTALHGRPVSCSSVELSQFNPPHGQTCGQYLDTFLKTAPGSLYNPNATSGCQYCPFSSADQYLALRNIFWSERWRNYGIFCAYFIFNIFGMIALYYLFRVKKFSFKKSKTH